jgi:alkylhydroperoxidase family enzyme
MTTPRLEPAEPPHSQDVADFLARIMPKGVAPLSLFTTMARAPRVFRKTFAGGYLDAGPLPLRLREIVIDRTTARRNCAYEWGVHVAFFAEKAGFDAAQLRSLAVGSAADACWSAAQDRLAIRLVDSLVDASGIDDALWADLETAFAAEQILEMIAIAGFYTSISYLANAMRLAPESYAAAFPSAG